MSRASRGQASVEAVAGIGILLLAGLVGFQLLGAGYAAVMAGHAAEAAAMATITGGDPRGAAQRAVPGWPHRALRVTTRHGSTTVTLLPPSPFRFLDGRIRVSAEASARPPR